MLVSSIANFERDPRLAGNFEDVLQKYKDALASATKDFVPAGDLRRIYVQYQFDAQGARNATRGIKLGRYSPKNQHLEATIEVKREWLENSDDRSRTVVIANLMLDALRQMSKRIKGKVANNLDEFIALIESNAAGLETH